MQRAARLTSTERSRKSREDPAYKARETAAAKQARDNLSSDRRAEYNERRNATQRRCYNRAKLAENAGGQSNYSAWLPAYLNQCQLHPQTDPPQIAQTIRDFQEKGYRIIRGALTGEQLARVQSEAYSTYSEAAANHELHNMFSGLNDDGEVIESDERQMTFMKEGGYTFRLTESLISQYLGEMDGHFGLKVGKLSLMDTQTDNPQPWHADYNLLTTAQEWRARFPVGGIICFENGSKFETFEGGLDDELTTPITEHLGPGDVVLFHGAKVRLSRNYVLLFLLSNYVVS